MNIQEKIKEWIKETLKIQKDFVLAHPKDIENGDYSFFAASENPKEYLEKLEKNKLKEIERIEMVGKFINFYLSKDFFAESVKDILDSGDKIGNNKLNKEKTIIEYTDPNPFKQFHIGHLMSNTIGESISRITEANGVEVKRANYQGDVGMHVAKTIWGKIQKPEMSWGEVYAYGAKNYDENKNEITEINKKIYDKSDEKINELYDKGKKDSLDYFEIMYEELGTKFDFYFFESEVGEEGKKVVLEFLKKGIFEESDGAVVFRGEKYDKKLHTRVFINSQGLPVYEAKELALAKIKYEKYKYDKSIVITGNEIDEYFKVLLAAMNEVFPDLASKTKHLSHGMLRLPTGKMASRTGDVITAESLIDQVKEKVLDKIKGREFSEQVKNELAEIVAIGAIKYSILKQAIGGDIIFDFDKSISFEGDSGPYLQYACVRANSVLEKFKAAKMISSVGFADFSSKNMTSEIILTAPVTELERYLYRFPEVVERAGAEYAPHYIVTYLTELAGIFNSFYANNKIIDENDPTSPYKISLTAATAHILKSGLYLLGIKVPERM